MGGAYINWGQAGLVKGEHDEALADLYAAIRLDAREELFYKVRGQIRLDKGERDAALADFTRSIRLERK